MKYKHERYELLFVCVYIYKAQESEREREKMSVNDTHRPVRRHCVCH